MIMHRLPTHGVGSVPRSDRSVAPKLESIPGGFRVRLRYGKGLRGRFLLKGMDEREAERRAARLHEVAMMLTQAGHSEHAATILAEAANARSAADFRKIVEVADKLCSGKIAKDAPKALTFRMLGTRWTDGSLASQYPDHIRMKKTAHRDKAALDWICDVSIAPGLKFGVLPLSAVSLDHCQKVMANLPNTARTSGARRQYAQVIHRVLELAVFPCRLLAANPLPRGFVPPPGKRPAYPYLYPEDDAALLRCTAIPLGRRMLWGFLAREGCRVSEAAAMQCGVNVNLERGACSLDSNKTDDPRAWALDSGVVRALRVYQKLRGARAGDALLVDDAGLPFETKLLAKQLRADLEAAGVTRPELFHNGENTRNMRAHDLRGTFVTLNLANGKTETWVSDRTGHQSSVMINRYRRAARSANELGLGSLLPLDLAIPETCEVALEGMAGGLRALCSGVGQKMGQRRKTASGNGGSSGGNNGRKLLRA